jgi:hypothetical protein
VKRRELVRHLARFGCVLADEGQSIANTSISPIRAVLRRFQGTPKSPTFSRARFAASLASRIQNKKASPVTYTFRQFPIRANVRAATAFV